MELGKLKALLGIPGDDTSQDIPLQFVIDDVTEAILNYCNLKELPPGLESTGYRMAMDLYRGEAVGEAAVPVEVTSVSEGDTSTSFGVSGAYAALQGGLLKDYQTQLNRYRKLVW